MPDRDEITALVRRYVIALDNQDVDALVGTFTHDAVQHDPVGEGPNVGHAAIRAFFEQSCSVAFAAELDGPVTVHGRHAAFRIRIAIPAGRTPFRLLITDLVEVVEVDGEPCFAMLQAVPDARVLN